MTHQIMAAYLAMIAQSPMPETLAWALGLSDGKRLGCHAGAGL